MTSAETQNVIPTDSVKNQETLFKCLFFLSLHHYVNVVYTDYQMYKEHLIKNSHLANIPVICVNPAAQVCFPPLPLADLDWNICDLTETRSNGISTEKTLWENKWKLWGVQDFFFKFLRIQSIKSLAKKVRKEI